MLYKLQSIARPPDIFLEIRPTLFPSTYIFFTPTRWNNVLSETCRPEGYSSSYYTYAAAAPKEDREFVRVDGYPKMW